MKDEHSRRGVDVPSHAGFIPQERASLSDLRLGISTRPFCCAQRRGSAYLMVLAVAMIVATMGLGALVAIRAQMRAVSAAGDAIEARQYALSAIELGRLWISQDAQWRTNRPHGVWAASQPIGSGTFTLEVTDPVDNNLANRPHDPVVLKATAVKGQARHMVQVTLAASPTPLSALAYPLQAGGEIHVTAGHVLRANRATVSTNGGLHNDATIVGNVEALFIERLGIVIGTVATGVPSKTFPPASVVDLYANLGTEIAPGTTIDKQVLAPGRNPWGAANPEGVYVIRTNSYLVIRNSRIHGTLVVISPGKKVTLGPRVLLQSYRSDYPALIVDGDCILAYASDQAISESAISTNLNPAGAPYRGVTDSDTTDEYPAEIHGLVHVRGKLSLRETALVRGAILCESTATVDAVKAEGNNEIVYDRNLYLTPPQGYTSSVKMIPQSGTWRQLVD